MIPLGELRRLRLELLSRLKAQQLFARQFVSELTHQKHLAKGYPHDWAINVADVGNTHSLRVAERWATLIEGELGGESSRQAAGSSFEQILVDFLNAVFGVFVDYDVDEATKLYAIRGGDPTDFDQYRHLRDVKSALRKEPKLEAVFGRDYTIKPDVIVGKKREAAREANDVETAELSPYFRSAGYSDPAADRLHAIISCKLTIRNDRVQNVRPEAANALRTRKGRSPHIVCYTADPMPSRIASIALGTGDVDCVYHSALPELRRAMEDVGPESEQRLLKTLIEGRRLRDVADLALDLCD
jgi:hypothetical protein